MKSLESKLICADRTEEEIRGLIFWGCGRPVYPCHSTALKLRSKMCWWEHLLTPFICQRWCAVDNPCDWNWWHLSSSIMKAPSLSSVTGSAEVKTVGSGSIEDFMRWTWGDLLSWQPWIDAWFTRSNNQNWEPFRDLAIHLRREKL
jgi:hypothetical protein